MQCFLLLSIRNALMNIAWKLLKHILGYVKQRLLNCLRDLQSNDNNNFMHNTQFNTLSWYINQLSTIAHTLAL